MSAIAVPTSTRSSVILTKLLVSSLRCSGVAMVEDGSTNSMTRCQTLGRVSPPPRDGSSIDWTRSSQARRVMVGIVFVQPVDTNQAETRDQVVPSRTDWFKHGRRTNQTLPLLLVQKRWMWTDIEPTLMHSRATCSRARMCSSSTYPRN